MFDWNSPVFTYGLLTVFFLLLYFVLFILSKSINKKLTLKFPLYLAAASYLLRLMELEKCSRVIKPGESVIFLAPAGFLAFLALIELLVTLVYRIFHIDKKLDEQSSNPSALNEQGSVSRPFLYNRTWDQHGK